MSRLHGSWVVWHRTWPLAAGDKNDTGAEAARAQFYFAVDQPFRRWLQGIDPETDEPVEKAAEWQEQAYRLAAELSKQMVEQAGTAAFIGHRGSG